MKCQKDYKAPRKNDSQYNDTLLSDCQYNIVQHNSKEAATSTILTILKCWLIFSHYDKCHCAERRSASWMLQGTLTKGKSSVQLASSLR
jgi:hypothetical protein